MLNARQPRFQALSSHARRWFSIGLRFAIAFLNWGLDKFPIVGRDAFGRRRAVVLEPFVKVTSLAGSLILLVLAATLPLFCLIYGFFFALSVPYIIVPFVIPIAFLGILVIWSLPDQKTAPTFGLELLLPAFMIVLVLWPDYLAISLPGLPWITLLRLTGFPMTALLLVCLSVSDRFRKEVRNSLGASKPLTGFLFAFVAIQILTIPFSDHLLASAQLVFAHQVNWTCVFVISCLLFRDIRYVERYFALLVGLAVALTPVMFYETFRRHTPWMSHIPGFLKVPDGFIALVLKPNIRIFVDRYRAKATFYTPLGTAEFLSLMTPLFLHFAFSNIRPVLRIGVWLTIPLLFAAVWFTDSRLGMVGLLVTLVLYGFLWSIVRWRARQRDLVAAAMVYAYPALAAAFIGLISASGKARVMILGGQAQASSNEMRDSQLTLALHALSKQPVGFGAGQSGPSLGLPPGDFISVDNYFITIAMDYGFLGAFLWYGIFVVGIFEAVRCCLSRETADKPEARLLAPLAVSLTGLLILKWVHGQDGNHPIFFMMLGMIAALIYRLRQPQSPVLTR